MRRSPLDVDQQGNSLAARRNSVRGTGLKRAAADQLRSEDPNWLLIDEGFTLAREHEIESLFAITNGYVGNLDHWLWAALCQRPLGNQGLQQNHG